MSGLISQLGIDPALVSEPPPQPAPMLTQLADGSQSFFPPPAQAAPAAPSGFFVAPPPAPTMPGPFREPNAPVPLPMRRDLAEAPASVAEALKPDPVTETALKNIDAEYSAGRVKAAERLRGTSGVTGKAEETASASADPAAAIAAEHARQTATGAVSGTPHFVAGGYSAGRNPWRKEGKEAYLDAQGREANAATQLGDIAASDQMRAAAQTAELADKLKIQDDAQRLAETKRAEEAQRREGSINAALDDVRTAKIDPLKGYKDLGVGGSIIGVIGAALGGAAQAMTGGRNPMLEQLDKLTQSAIDAQKSDIDNKKAGIQGQMSLLGQMRQRFGDERQAEIAARMAIREGAALKAEELAQTSGSAKAMANAQLMRAGVDKANALERRQLIDIPEFVPPHMSGPQVAGQVADIKESHLIKGLHGELIVSRDEKGAEKANNRIAYESQIGQLQGQAAGVFHKYGRSALIPGTEGNNKLEQIKEAAIPVQSMATEQGVVREFERDPTLKAIGLGGYGITTLQDPAAYIANAQKNLHSGSQQLLKQYGGQVVKPVDTAGPDGKVRRVYQYVSPGSTTTGDNVVTKDVDLTKGQ